MSSIKKKYISTDNLNGVGIFFARREDPVSHFFTSIAKQPYSLIGFYYSTTICGKKQIQVVVADFFDIITPLWLDPSAIDKLVNDPLISELAVKKLRPVRYDDGGIDLEKTEQLETCFREAICEAVKYGAQKSPREWISQLFGYHGTIPSDDGTCSSNDYLDKGLTAVELVNYVIKQVDEWDKVPQNGMPVMDEIKKLDPSDHYSSSAKGRLQVIDLVGKNFKQVPMPDPDVPNKLIQSYLADNELFGKIKYISLPDRNQSTVDLAIAKSSLKYREYMRKIIATFVDMIMDDEQFFETVVAGINQNKDVTMLSEIYQITSKLIQYSDMALQPILKSLMCPCTKVDRSKFIAAVKGYNSARMKYQCATGPITPSELPIPCDKASQTVYFTDSPNNEMLLAIDSLKDQISAISKELETTKKGTIDLKKLASNVNKMIQLSNCNVPQIKIGACHSSYPGVIVVDSAPDMKVKLKYGQKIILPTIGYDLGQFNHDQLLEIFNFLESVIKDNPQFSHLREDIVAELAK